MATGIVSVAMHDDGQEAISLALLALGALLWALLGVLFLHRLLRERPRWHADAREASSLTAVAATAVLGVRAAELGWSGAGWTSLAIATALYILVASILARAPGLPRTGIGFLLTVAPQSLAVLAASLAFFLRIAWPADFALAPFAVGLGSYLVVLMRFDYRELRAGDGDQWVAAGALAISTLACSEIGRAASAAGTLGGAHSALRTATVVLWALTMAWLPVLLVAEASWPRPRYHLTRWATIFPLGMYAVMSISAGELLGAGWITNFGEAWSWLALAAWLAAAIGAARRLLRLRAG